MQALREERSRQGAEVPAGSVAFRLTVLGSMWGRQAQPRRIACRIGELERSQTPAAEADRAIAVPTKLQFCEPRSEARGDRCDSADRLVRPPASPPDPAPVEMRPPKTSDKRHTPHPQPAAVADRRKPVPAAMRVKARICIVPTGLDTLPVAVRALASA